jgi:hypothetical protein
LLKPDLKPRNCYQVHWEEFQMPAYLKMLRPSILGDYGGPFMCIVLTGNDSNFLIFTAVTSNIPTVFTLLLLTHKISLLTKAVRKFVMSEHQLSHVYFNHFITYRYHTDRWNRTYHCKNIQGYSKRQEEKWTTQDPGVVILCRILQLEQSRQT